MFNINVKELLNKKKLIKSELNILNNVKPFYENKESKGVQDTRTISQVFSQFCKERHEEDKKLHKSKHFNELQEVYAETELFDLSFIPENPHYQVETRGITAQSDSLINCSLPFSSIFMKISGNSGNAYIFAREFSPTQITGTLYVVLEISPNYTVQNNPFILDTETGKVTLMNDRMKLFKKLLELDTTLIHNIRNNVLSAILCDVTSTLQIINSLNKHKVYSETKANEKTEYFRRKGKPTLKVNNRPLYYVLEPKDTESEKKVVHRASNTCRIELNHSFKVRGHWRKIDPQSYGKNRNGEYVVIGHTWVRDHVKGTGEMVKKLRVIKKN